MNANPLIAPVDLSIGILTSQIDPQSANSSCARLPLRGQMKEQAAQEQRTSYAYIHQRTLS
jgi:hypothetical protein